MNLLNEIGIYIMLLLKRKDGYDIIEKMGAPSILVNNAGITQGKLTPALKAEIIESIPMRRIGLPIDVARICLFFASELSGYVTGEIMDVNGGMHID